MKMIKVAIIGAGSMAREHIHAFGSLENVIIKGIFSRTRSRAEALAREMEIPVVADDIADLKRRTGADLVVVAVPELAANAVAKATFVEDWAVLLEKPAGYDLADSHDIAAAAEGREKPVMVGFNRRFYHSVMTAKADLDSRDELRLVTVQDQQSYAEARRYNHPEAVVRKFMYANSIHNIDLIPALCRGELVELKQLTPWKGEETEILLVHLRYSSGDIAVYEGIWKGPGPWACSISTPSRRWTLQPLERASFQNAGERVTNPVDPAPEDVKFKAGFVRQAEAVLDKMAGRSSRAVDLAESLRTMTLIHKMFGV